MMTYDNNNMLSYDKEIRPKMLDVSWAILGEFFFAFHFILVTNTHQHRYDDLLRYFIVM
jgi:hypothetical protein